MGFGLDHVPNQSRNEITAIKELLPVLALEGAVVTIDAMGCQTAIAAQIKEAKGHYVQAVKDNQPQLADALRDFFATLNRPGHPHRDASTSETLDKGHGRLETRRCVAVGELDRLDTMGLRDRWPGLAAVACIESQRHIGDKIETDTRYVISSLPTEAARTLHAVRTPIGASKTASTGVSASPSAKTPAPSACATPRTTSPSCIVSP